MGNDHAIRILIADDHAAVREGLVALLACTPNMHVVGVAGDGREAVDLFRRLRPDLVLMDISMPGGGVEATAIIRSQWPTAKIICMSVMDNGQFVRARNAGAAACLLKDVPHEELTRTIRTAYQE